MTNIMCNKPIRILYLSSANESLGNHHHRFLQALVNAKYDVHLVSYHPLPIAQNIRDINGLNIYHYPPKLIKKALFFNRVFHFKQVLRKINPDILHSGNVPNISFLAALSAFHPLLVMPNGSDVLIYPKKYRLIKLINNYVFSKTDWVTCDAKYVKEQIVKDYNYEEEKITVFPWGIELDIFKESHIENSLRKKLGWEDKIVLISNRHFEPVYDHKTLVEAYKLALVKNSDLRLLLVGDGKLREDICKLINEYGLEKYIYLTGRISREEMAHRLNEADVYITTSISDGTSVSLLEAFACKKPVIVSDIPCNREWIKNGENGFLASVGDVQMFSKHIVTLGSNKTLQSNMGKFNGDLAKEKADWLKNFQKLENIYSSLLYGE